jgi:hypothetical protein
LFILRQADSYSGKMGKIFFGIVAIAAPTDNQTEYNFENLFLPGIFIRYSSNAMLHLRWQATILFGNER